MMNFEESGEALNPCPTPHKVIYSSRGVAKRAAVESRKSLHVRLRVYVCVCGNYHLTKGRRHRPTTLPPLIGVAQLLALRDDQLTLVARYDVNESLDENEAVLLRHPDVVDRWLTALLALHAEVEYDFTRAGARTGGTPSARATSRKDDMLARIAQRRDECEDIRRQRDHHG